jgi:hypothetical protein
LPPFSDSRTANSRDRSWRIRAMGCADGAVDVLLAGLGDLRERLLAGGVDGREVLARRGLDELAADEEAVAVLEGDDVARFRGGRVVPAGRHRRAVLASLQISQA